MFIDEFSQMLFCSRDPVLQFMSEVVFPNISFNAVTFFSHRHLPSIPDAFFYAVDGLSLAPS